MTAPSIRGRLPELTSLAMADTDGWKPTEDFWRGRKVGVTGANGFVGAHLTAALVTVGADVSVLVRDDRPVSPIADGWRDDVSVVKGNLEDLDAVTQLMHETEVVTVFHLGAQSQVGAANANPVGTFKVNIEGTWNVLEAARRDGSIEQLVVASSDKAYGAQPALLYDEDMALLARYPYDVSKACADLLTQAYWHMYGLPTAVTRCGNIFGPGDTNWQRLVPGATRSLLRGERPVIRSDGTPVRDYLYVVDAVHAYLQLAEVMSERPEILGEAFNFSSGEPLSTLELVALLQQTVGTDLDPIVGATATGEVDVQHRSSEKAKRVLGWTPHQDTRGALTDTVSWYRDHLGVARS